MTAIDYPDPVDVGLDIICRDGQYAWGLALPDDDFRRGALARAATLTDARLAAVTILATDPALTGVPVNLTCADADLTEALIALHPLFPNVEVRPFTLRAKLAPLARAARAHAHTALDHANGTGAATTPARAQIESGPARRVRVGTDGSYGRGGTVGGWGWITETGRYAFGHVDATDPLTAELAAIRAALGALSARTPLEVVADSRAALALLDRAQHAAHTGERLDHATGDRRVDRVVASLPGLLRERDVTFRWVRGHSGDPLNEGADRLAVHARRSAQATMNPDDRALVARHIAAETASLLAAAAERAHPLAVPAVA